MKVVSIHQPAYLPWLGYFHKVAASDVFVFLDTVQFEKNSFTNRNRIRTRDGTQWLTVPVNLKGHTARQISEIEISSDERWKRKHTGSIQMSYGKAGHFDRFYPDVERFILNAGNSFSDLVYDMTIHFLEKLKIDTEVIRSSALPVDGRKSELVMNICKHLGADVYLSGKLGRDYIDGEHFRENGVEVAFQDYRHPVYRQTYDGFFEGMCVLDLLMNTGKAEALPIIMSGNVKREELKGGRR